MRGSVLAMFAGCGLVACAPYKSEESGGKAYYESRTSTGSNILKKGDAIIVDPSVLEDQMRRSNGGPARGSP